MAEGTVFFLTTVYASPKPTESVLLWDTLKDLSSSVVDPWAVIGDFNLILSAVDKRGGVPFNRPRNKSFIDAVDVCGLSDFPFQGPRFTWARNNVLVRLDKTLVNGAWMSCFPESSVLHLHKLKSDHRPIILRCHTQDLTKDLCHWNKFVFGNIFRSKRRLTKELNQAELRVTTNPSPVHLSEERQARSKLEAVLWQEEALWLQKSRSMWLTKGDRNTNFFHLATLRRRAFNRMSRLKDHNGIWITDQPVLLSMAMNYFKTFYSSS
ncbi:hypothetical protein LINPERHAP2_LOCUS4585, partial [Linum perenne]